MWLRSIFLKSLRDHRIGVLGWGVGMGLLVVSPMAAVSELIRTPEARAELVTLAKQFAWNADAVQVDTPGGYATFKIGTFIFIMAVWAILTGARLLRRDEERGSMDVLLSLPRGRTRVALAGSAGPSESIGAERLAAKRGEGGCRAEPTAIN